MGNLLDNMECCRSNSNPDLYIQNVYKDMKVRDFDYESFKIKCSPFTESNNIIDSNINNNTNNIYKSMELINKVIYKYNI